MTFPFFFWWLLKFSLIDFNFKPNTTWLSDLGLLTKIQKNGQSCQSETKEKEISSSCLTIYSFVSRTDCTTKTVEVIGEVSHSSILYRHLPICTAASFHVQITSLPSVIPPHTIAAPAAAPTQAGSHRKAEGRCQRDLAQDLAQLGAWAPPLLVLFLLPFFQVPWTKGSCPPIICVLKS